MSRNTDSSIFGLADDTTNAEIDSLDVHDENHNIAELDEGNRTRCMLCSTFQLSLVARKSFTEETTPLDLYQFLHEECFTCKRLDDSETKLCDFCRHIRLRHILTCSTEFHSKFFGESLVLEVDFGGLEAVRSRRNCSLCRLVADTVSIYAQETSEANRSSIPSSARLKADRHGSMTPDLYVGSNLLNEDVSIVGKNLRPSGMLIYKGVLRALANTFIFR